MGLWDKIKGEFIDIVEWPEQSGSALVYKFERYNNEIKYGAKLVVREGQAAAFVNQGKLADVYTPGTHGLTTSNMPILSTLMGWPYGFESPFKAEVYFVSTRQFTDMKWGTKNPIMLRDAEFGPLRLRAFGTYAARVSEPGVFLKELVGANPDMTTDDVANTLRNMIVARFTDILGESKIPALDLAANYDELSNFVTTRLRPEFEKFGMALTQFLVENISLPPEVEAMLDKRTSMGIVGNLQQYTQFQAANAMEQAAKNPGTTGGMMGMAVGMSMANTMGQVVGGAAGSAPPPIPGATAATFFIAVNGQQTGPFDLAALQRSVQGGQLTRDSLVWRHGMAAWEKAGAVIELNSLFANVPPPLPG